MISPRDGSPIGTSSIPSPSPGIPKRVLVVFGTRPEAIKLCPLVAALREHASSQIEITVCVTAQHRQMLDQVLAAFAVEPHYDLNVMQPGQGLTVLTSRLLAALEPVLAEVRPSLVVVQGDTTTTLCGALAAFYARVPVAHVEAGLRTYDMHSPFPEEMNRAIATRLADLHFAPTKWAADNLLREGVPDDHVYVTGNTGIDAVLAVSGGLQEGRLSGLTMPIDERKKLIVVTAHRRESFGPGFERICQAIADLSARGDVQVIWPVHPNPNVQKTVDATLRGNSNITLIEPLEYVPFVDLMRRSYLLITDSGGVQEEGPSLGKPILVLREKTERPEAVKAGTVKVVGTDRQAIVREASRLLDDPQEYERMSHVHNPYGDGKACVRIVSRIAEFLRAST
jgi:UDP-N-acetylglucosamine 2-epimerase (non-hydrolysing)